MTELIACLGILLIIFTFMRNSNLQKYKEVELNNVLIFTAQNNPKILLWQDTKLRKSQQLLDNHSIIKAFRNNT
jgi:hypothetical protein